MRLPGRLGCEHGTALICALMVTTLLGTLGGAVVVLGTLETMIGANHAAAEELLYAADAAIERAVGDLRMRSDWRTVPGDPPSATDDFRDGTAPPRLPDGTVLNLALLTARRQSDNDAIYQQSVNRPVWRLFAHAPLGRLLPAGHIPSTAYVVLWIADDAEDVDGDPLADSNDLLLLHAEAFGLRGARRRIEAAVAREVRNGGTEPVTPPGEGGGTEVRMITWRQVP